MNTLVYADISEKDASSASSIASIMFCIPVADRLGLNTIHA
jgi:hypothetical protein